MIAQIVSVIFNIAGGIIIAVSLLVGAVTITLWKKRDKSSAIAGVILTILVLFIGIMFFVLGKLLCG